MYGSRPTGGKSPHEHGLAAHVRDSERLKEAGGWRLPLPLSLLLACVHAFLMSMIALFAMTSLTRAEIHSFWSGPGPLGISLGTAGVVVTIALMLLVPADYLRWRASGRGRPWLHFAALALLGVVLSRVVPLMDLAVG